MITAAKTLAQYPGSKIAQENVDVFADMYQWLVSDVTTVVKGILDASQMKPEKPVYMSLPRPGVRLYFHLYYLFKINAYVETRNDFEAFKGRKIGYGRTGENCKIRLGNEIDYQRNGRGN